MDHFSQRLERITAAQRAGRAFDFEGMLERHYRSLVRRGDTVADVGAHTGRHLACLLECVGPTGRVLAFEPLPFAFRQLQARFDQPNVTLCNVALAGARGRLPFVHAEGTPEESGLRQRVYNTPAAARPRQIEVAVETLDDQLESVPGLRYVKVDVEGGEMDVLSGARGVLSKQRPFLSVEYGQPGYSAYGHGLFTLFDFAEAGEYAMYDVFGHRLGRGEWPRSCDVICWDFFMVPVEKTAEFEHFVPPVALD
jgi:FkbM family methyltransferase